MKKKMNSKKYLRIVVGIALAALLFVGGAVAAAAAVEVTSASNVYAGSDSNSQGMITGAYSYMASGLQNTNSEQGSKNVLSTQSNTKAKYTYSVDDARSRATFSGSEVLDSGALPAAKMNSGGTFYNADENNKAAESVAPALNVKYSDTVSKDAGENKYYKAPKFKISASEVSENYIPDAALTAAYVIAGTGDKSAGLKNVGSANVVGVFDCSSDDSVAKSTNSYYKREALEGSSYNYNAVLRQNSASEVTIPDTVRSYITGNPAAKLIKSYIDRNINAIQGMTTFV